MVGVHCSPYNNPRETASLAGSDSRESEEIKYEPVSYICACSRVFTSLRRELTGRGDIDKHLSGHHIMYNYMYCTCTYMYIQNCLGSKTKYRVIRVFCV